MVQRTRPKIPAYPIIPRGSHAEICPVCHGTGKIIKKLTKWSTEEEVECHGCHGRGWITVYE